MVVKTACSKVVVLDMVHTAMAACATPALSTLRVCAAATSRRDLPLWPRKGVLWSLEVPVATGMPTISAKSEAPFKTGSVLLSRVASGDQEGRVVVWDIATGTPVISLEDPIQAAGGARSKGGAVRGLAWVMANPARLAIVLAGGMVLVWDVQGKSCPLISRMFRGCFTLPCPGFS